MTDSVSVGRTLLMEHMVPFPYKHKPTIKFTSREYALKTSLGDKETADCSVRALGIAAGIGYKAAHELFHLYGRKFRRGTTKEVSKKLMTERFADAKFL